MQSGWSYMYKPHSKALPSYNTSQCTAVHGRPRFEYWPESVLQGSGLGLALLPQQTQGKLVQSAGCLRAVATAPSVTMGSPGRIRILAHMQISIRSYCDLALLQQLRAWRVEWTFPPVSSVPPWLCSATHSCRMACEVILISVHVAKSSAGPPEGSFGLATAILHDPVF